MDSKQTPFVDTDKAWNNLFRRLSDEGLLESRQPKSNRQLSFAPWMRWAASFLLLVATGLLIFLLGRGGEEDLFALHITNHDNTTLIQVLEDGSVVYLAENASLSLPEAFTDEHRTVFLSGEAFFDIESRQHQPFIILTESAQVKVLGTAFNIRSDHQKAFELYVEQGLVSVELTNDTRQLLLAEAGEMLTIDQGTLVKTDAADRSISSWKIQRMHFKDETLDNVLSVINKNYGSSLLIDQQELKNRRITVTFYNNTLPTILELLCLSMNLEAEQRADNAILLKPKT